MPTGPLPPANDLKLEPPNRAIRASEPGDSAPARWYVRAQSPGWHGFSVVLGLWCGLLMLAGLLFFLQVIMGIWGRKPSNEPFVLVCCSAFVPVVGACILGRRWIIPCLVFTGLSVGLILGTR